MISSGRAIPPADIIAAVSVTRVVHVVEAAGSIGVAPEVGAWFVRDECRTAPRRGEVMARITGRDMTVALDDPRTRGDALEAFADNLFRRSSPAQDPQGESVGGGARVAVERAHYLAVGGGRPDFRWGRTESPTPG
ncbi:hypothetical protein [Nocardia sp. NPDC050413]|uniref:hypothetical protein n=1 Tax=Nocardia sp. NPDC050413 TaxID=3155784 RepID=UPI0033F4CB20